MGSFKSAEKMVDIIESIYEEKFGGKKRGRFQISLSEFRRLAGRKRLREAFIDEVTMECLERGYILIQIADIIAIIEERVVYNYRNVPKAIINTYIDTEEEEDDVAWDKENDDD